ncbi:MAG: hypothetical protein ABIR68_19305 [Ilumatobacteraceae bacterium]
MPACSVVILDRSLIADQRAHRPIWNDLVAAKKSNPARSSAAGSAP